ncbi:MAG TPA: hypothetical protein VGI92_00205 [Gemmatimonadales bacterium]
MKFPHPLALLTGCIAIAAALTWVLPAGEYTRQHDAVTGRDVVVPGTFHAVAPTPVSPFQAVVAVPRGLADAGSVVFLVLLVGGAFVVVDQTGALRQATGALARSLEGRATLVIPVIGLFFATGGALENMSEEIIAMIPVLLVLMRQIGFDPLVAVAVSLGSAAVGAAFSPINPFQVGIAQKLAQLPLESGWAFRCVVLAIALAIWLGVTMRYAEKTKRADGQTGGRAEETVPERSGGRGGIVLALVLGTFAIFVYGVLQLGWDFDQMSALFFIMGIVAGLVGGLGVQGTAAAFAEGFGSMAYAAALIGFARGIFVVLSEGHIIDTVVHGVFTPIGQLPIAVSALVMMLAHVAIHFPVPSVSGQAVLTMPVLVPLSDLLRLPRQVTVLSFQYGAGLSELFWPTNGSLMAIVAVAGISYERWLKFAVPRAMLLYGVAAGAILVAITIGLR